MLAEAKHVPPPGFSLYVFGVLAVVFVLSVVIFVQLVRRWTRSRLWLDILDWARQHGYRPLDASEAPGPWAAALPSDGSTVAQALSSEQQALIRLRRTDAAGQAVPASHWHVLVRRIETDWPTTALRPAGAQVSLVDLYSLSSFPLMGQTQRFVVYGTDSAPARKVSKSSLRTLLPADIPLLLHGRYLLLDFSSRPFDPIAFDRMAALAEQIAQHLPWPA
jgi:hypothetical protein